MKKLLKEIFGNPEQDRLIKRFETLNKAMQSNTRVECEYHLNLLKAL